MENQFTRTEMLFGAAAIDTLRQAHVAVFGVGGVGSYVVEVLARSGVGKLTLVDNDRVSISNINRQLVALTSTIGQRKVDVARQRVLDINPRCEVQTHAMFYLPETAASLDLSTCHYVVDCVDTMAAKMEIIKQCHTLNVPLICSMGAANKVDPTRIRVADIFQTKMDPLAKIIRKKLRKLGIGKLKVVYSDEEPLPPFAIEDATPSPPPANVMPDEFVPRPKRIQPASNAFVPGTAGLVLGGEVVKDLLRKAGAMRQDCI